MHSWVYEIKMEVSLKLKVVMEKFQSSESLRIEETNGKTKQILLNNEFTYNRTSMLGFALLSSSLSLLRGLRSSELSCCIHFQGLKSVSVR